MNIRFSLQTMIARALSSTRARTDALGRLHEQAGTGKRLLSVSDDPLAAAGALGLKGRDSQIRTYLENLRSARSQLDTGVATLRQVSNVLAQARDIALTANHSANDRAAMEALTQQLDGLLGRMMELANTEHGGRYLFGGQADQTTPFVITARDGQGRPTAVAYQGSQARADVAISTTVRVDLLYRGEEIFQARERQATIYTGDTGAAAGTGTDNATGVGALLVRHTATSYAGASGVAPGTGSVNGDTILGPAGAHQLTVIDTSGTGASGTISLNGGPPIAFSNIDTNLRVYGPAGETVFVDTTAIAPGFSGTLAITADGTLSVDGGVTSVPITFASNQVLTDSATAAITNVDSTNIRRAGTEILDYAGAQDVFQTLIALRDELRSAQTQTADSLSARITIRVAALDRLRENVLQGVAEQSVALENLDSIETHTEELRLELQKQASELESADLGDLVLRLQEEQYLLQLTLASTARLFDHSLVDFIR
jgi:flagellin-like hook-associated protein FlgL